MNQSNCPEIREITTTILCENTAGISNPAVLAEWGLATLIETKFDNGYIITILLDTGTTGDVLLHNAKMLDIDLPKIVLGRF